MQIPQIRSKQYGTTNDQRRGSQQPIRLSIITQFFPPDYAPTGQLIEELARHLAELGMFVNVFTGQPGYAFEDKTAPTVEEINQVRVRRSRTASVFPRRIRGKAISGLIFFLRSALHLMRNSPRSQVMLLTTAPPFLPALGFLVCKLFRRPYVCLLYDLYPDIATQLGVIPAEHWLARCWDAVNRQIWRGAQSIIVLSSTMKGRVQSKCPEVASKINVIHSWADPNRITPIDKQNNWFARQHNLVNKFTVLYSGNMGRCHDIDTIVSAATQLKNEPVQFVFIGGGAKRRDCAKKVAELGLDNFLFLPYQDKEVLPYSLTACDLSLVSISHDMEGLVAPSKLYSALAAGRPIAVICQKNSYLRPLIRQADCGATFENGDSVGLAKFIRLLIADRQLAQDMGDAGRQYLQSHFTPEVVSKQYFNVLRQAAYSSQ